MKNKKALEKLIALNSAIELVRSGQVDSSEICRILNIESGLPHRQKPDLILSHEKVDKIKKDAA